MMDRLPLVTAHTGCEGTPENSLESLRAGLEAGADTVEIDVRGTRDGSVVLMHDDYVEYEGQRRAVEELTLSEINDALSPPAILLEEAFEAFAAEESTLNLDLKDDVCIEPTVELVRRYGLSERVIITGCDAGRATTVRRVGPELPVLLNVGVEDAEIALRSYQEFADKICRRATESGCCGLNVPYALCRSELVRYARYRYLPVSVWTVDDEATMLDMAGMGVDSITTYRPKTLARLLAEEQRRSSA